MADSGKPETYSQISDELGMSEGAVKVAASRMRDRYRRRLSEVVCQTIADEDCLDDELNVLLSALRGPIQ